MKQTDFNFMREALMLTSFLTQLGTPHSLNYQESRKRICLKGPNGEDVCEVEDSKAGRDLILTLLRSEQDRALHLNR